MSELLPCPFCGGEAYTVNDGGRYWTVECHDCAAHTGLYATKDFAIAAWNTRHKRTCRIEDTTVPSNDDVWSTAKCSKCGANYTIEFAFLNYCPNCGAKVVGE